MLPKKPLGFTTLNPDNTNDNESLLGLPKENDWILNSFAFDPSFIRDYISYELARKMGNYASRGEFCELVLNGEYQGLYLLQEKLKVDGDRVNIKKLDPTDQSEPEITGGYIIKCDKNTGGDSVAWSDFTNTGVDANYIHDNPNPTEITSTQSDYIRGVFISLNTAARQSNANIKTGYPSVIDIPSFVDFILLNEFASNVDAYQFSTYFHKDRNGKLRAGPIWDFNLTYGMDAFSNRSRSSVWQFTNGDNEGSPFWKNLFENPEFNCYLAKRWSELSQNGEILHTGTIHNRIDELSEMLSEAAERNNNKWEGQRSLYLYEEVSHSKGVDDVKSFMDRRTNWLNEQLVVSGNCEFPTLPNLVISKIHYNPIDTIDYLGEDLEYIEITNNSDKEVDVTGYYFRELGFTYSFPNDTKLASDQKIILASNTEAYSSHYGFAPFGEFGRGLSNKSEKLELVDAFGNVVDFVEYQDSGLWPIDADGTGSHLELIDLNTDNNIGSNWKATKNSLSAANYNYASENKLVVFPNPAHEYVYISSSNKTVKQYELYDWSGRLILKSDVHSNNFKVNTTAISANTYILKIKFNDGTTDHSKLIVQ
ncbi:MAG: CotH kinase family protein [Flavobacteriales bacterium]|nr:CotH kinase family protein [Flavobacteriales bacterium]